MRNRAKLFEEIEMTSGYEVTKDQLREYYSIMYPNKVDFLMQNYLWLNNPDVFNYRFPQVGVHENKVIGHQNFTPFYGLLNNQRYTGGWGGDLSVLKAYRGTGIGMKLCRYLMAQTEIQFSFGTNVSMNMAKKRLTWVENYDTYMHFFSLTPLKRKKLPGAIRKIGNKFLQLGLYLYYKRNSVPPKSVTISAVDSENIKKLITRKEDLSENTVYTEYSYDQLKWRLLQSPYKDDYRIVDFQTLNLSVLIKIYELPDGQKHLDLMRTPERISDAELRMVISSLAIWALQEDISLIRYYTNLKDTSKFLSQNMKCSVQNPRCCFYSRDDKLFDNLKKSKWRFEIIDSDLEKF
jgi:GNAT superfamily N-acetyltransferase